jgi:hypothetical protein
MPLKFFFHRFFSTLHGFTLLLFISILVGAAYGILSLQQMNTEARNFVNMTMLELFADWDNKDFVNRTSTELQQQMTISQLNDFNIVFSQLGDLLNYHGAYGGLFRASASIWHLNPRYKVTASFQGGQFTAFITLIKRQGKWAIGRFEYKYTFFPNKRHSGSLKMV